MQGLRLREQVSRLRALLACGATIRQAEAELGVPRSTLYDLATRHKLQRRRAGLSPEKQRDIKRRLAKGQSLYRIAREVPVSTRTAWRWREYFPRIRDLMERARTPLPCKPWRCPGGGELLKVSYCIAHHYHKPARTSKRPRS